VEMDRHNTLPVPTHDHPGGLERVFLVLVQPKTSVTDRFIMTYLLLACKCRVHTRPTGILMYQPVSSG